MIRVLMQEDTVKDVVYDVKVPSEQVVEIRDGKKRISKRLFLPGYVLLEMDLPESGWKSVYSRIRSINGVTGFVSSDSAMRPRPIPKREAREILQKVGDIQGAAPVKPKQIFTTGESVRIIEGPFESFTGNVEEVNVEKARLRIIVGIFGRPTPVEVDFLQVEKA